MSEARTPSPPPSRPPVPPAPPRRAPKRPGGGGARLVTAARIVGHFAHRQRWFLLPLVLVLLCAGVLLVLTGGLSYVAPFVYSIF